MRLTATLVKQAKTPRRYGDGRGGHGLTLVVRENAGGGVSKAWVQRIRINGERLTSVWARGRSSASQKLEPERWTTLGWWQREATRAAAIQCRRSGSWLRR